MPSDPPPSPDPGAPIDPAHPVDPAAGSEPQTQAQSRPQPRNFAASPDPADPPGSMPAPPVIEDAPFAAAAPDPVVPVSGFSANGRLHPLSPLFALSAIVRGMIIPVVIYLVLGRDRVFGGVLLIFVTIPMVMALVRYFTYSFRVERDELVTREGVFSRTERNIPLARVQDIRIEQGMLHRLFGVADVHVDTAGGQGAEASLSVLAKADAEQLRALVFAQKAGLDPGVAGAGIASAEPEEHLIRRLGIRDLIFAGLTSNHLASAAALIAVGWGLLDDFIPREAHERVVQQFVRQAEEWTTRNGSGAWLAYAGAGVALLLVGTAISIGGSILLFHRFTLSKRGNDLHRHYGLLTRRSSSLPCRRIQVLKIEETLLRRWFRLATLRLDTAGGSRGDTREAKGGRDVLLPVVPRDEVEPMLPLIFPDLNPEEGEWRRVSRRAIRRGTFKGSLVCLALALAVGAVERSLWGLWPLALIPLVYVLNVMSYRHLGYWLGARYFRTRRGWLSRSGHVVPIRNTQAIVVRQNPWDRRHGVATLQVDTAGQAYTGGGPQISNVLASEADALAWHLARQAAATRFRW